MTNSVRLIRIVLLCGSTVFLLSAVLLLAAPATFASALGLDDSDSVVWSMRMIGACLLGLSGQMWLVRRGDDASVRGGAAVMVIAGGAMTILTVTIPGDWTLMRWAYLAFGATFWTTYVVLLIAGRQGTVTAPAR
jgi:peptidoglycan/LPS O-acetylase OafA/YrhL